MAIISVEIKPLAITMFFIILTCAYTAMSGTLLESSIAAKTTHEQWMNDFGRTYANDAEKEKRFKIFAENVKYIEKFNRDGKQTYKLGLNNFSDLTNEEFATSHSCGGLKNKLQESSIVASVELRINGSEILTETIPTTKDWRESGAVTDIKQQINCGSCWAFGTIAAVEGIMKIKNITPLTTLSAQELIDCVDKAKYGCKGGEPEDALSYIARKGIATDVNYPYLDREGECLYRTKRRAAKTKGFKRVFAGEQKLLEVVAQQPVAVKISTNDNFQHYAGGIFGSGPCGPVQSHTFDHVVAVIGYGGTTDEDKYWLIKNSWGTWWGENGYMRLKRQGDSPHPVCGIAMISSFYPTVE